MTEEHTTVKLARALYSDAIFARRVREVRKQAQVTQKQLADRMTAAGYKMHHSAIARIEAGDRPVSIGEAVHLANFLGVPLAWLLADVNAESDREREHRARVEAQLAVRALQHECAKKHNLLEEAKVLYENAAARLVAAQKRLRDLGGELPWDTPGVPPGAGPEGPGDVPPAPR